MKKWIRDKNRKALWNVLLIVTLAFVAVFAVTFIIMLLDGEKIVFDLSIFVALLILIFVVDLFIAVILMISYKIMSNNVLKRQAAMGINTNVELGQLEEENGVAIVGDWCFCAVGIAYAFHRDYIEDIRIERYRSGRYYVTGIVVYTADKRNYKLSVNKKKMQSVMQRLMEFKNGNTNDLFNNDYTPGNSEYSTLNPDTSMMPKEDNAVRNTLIVLGVCASVAVLLVIGYNALAPSDRVSGDRVSNDIIQEIVDYSSYDNIEDYTIYLDEVNAKFFNAEVFSDYTGEEGVYLLEVANESNYFFNATLVLYDKDKKKIDSGIEVYMSRPGSRMIGEISLSSEPVTYEFTDINVLDFYYEAPVFDYDISDDYDEDYFWRNVIIDNEDYDINSIEVLLKHLYGECVVADQTFDLIYLYDDSYETYEFNGYEYINPYSAINCATIDLEEKLISFYSFDENEEFVLEEEWRMN